MKTDILKVAKSALGKTGLKIKKYSPEILVGVGTVSIVAGVVFACKETLKIDEVVEQYNDKKSQIDEAIEREIDNYSIEDAKKDKAILTIKTYGKIAKNYIPATSLILTGIGCFYASYGILKKRNLAISAAYEAIDIAYKNYRNRVKEEIGDERENELFHGIGKTKIEQIEQDANGKDKKVKKEVKGFTDDPNKYSPYAKFFDEMSKCYKNDPEYNMVFLKAQQSYANDLLKVRGHLFLNEVYDMLDIPRTQAGQVVGWILGAGDDFVDFGLYADRERARAFVNGLEPAILLDFNVDGVIYDKI